MCNPRRIEVTATRQVAEGWSREVRRVAERRAMVAGEARMRQPLDASVGAAALAAMEDALDEGVEGWRETEQGFRFEVEGGFVLFDPETRTLEIVAALADEVSARGEARATVEGRVDGEISASGAGDYYDDGWGGRTEAFGRREAEAAAERALDGALQAEIDTAADAAVAEQDAALTADAERDADAQLARAAEERRAELARQAARHLEAVGVRARYAFHRLLAEGYRRALLAMARRRGATGISCRDDDEYLELDFMLPD